MDDVYGKIEVFPQHFQPPKEPTQNLTSSNTASNNSLSSVGHSWAIQRVMGAASLLNFLPLPRFKWLSGSDGDDDKVELTRAELESLQREIADADERESQLKARLENVDEILKSARLCGYLYIRTRWTQLPGEPPILDDADVDDWLPRFVVLQGSCLFYFLKSTDLSPQDTTMLSDIVEVGQLPSFWQDKQTRNAFYMLTHQGLKVECSSSSEIQVDSWIGALKTDCKLLRNGSPEKPTIRQKLVSL